MRMAVLISRIITGLVFIFSGTVKAIDPLGSAYKFHDYFQAFHLKFMEFLSLPFSFILFTLEFLAGLSVLTGLKYRTGTWIIFIMMLVFTPLTLVLALTNPVSDCGCFGDALHLTNWQTFGKNIILLSLAILLFTERNRFKAALKPASQWILISTSITVFLLFSLYNLRYLPVIDFLPYKTGTNIPEKMAMPAGASPDEYNTTFIYEKNGVQKKFTIDNYPANDTAWKFVDQKTKLIKKGYQPPIHDLTITTMNNEDITGQILSDTGYTLLMISKRLDAAATKNLQKGFELGQYLSSTPVSFYVLTSSDGNEAAKYKNGLHLCFTDETTLKTMIRSNPGYILLKGGTIIGKWSWADLPEKEYYTGL